MRWYGVVSGFYLLSFSLVMINVILLQYQKTEPVMMTRLRILISFTNMLVLSVSLLTFEISSFLADTAGYI